MPMIHGFLHWKAVVIQFVVKILDVLILKGFQPRRARGSLQSKITAEIQSISEVF